MHYDTIPGIEDRQILEAIKKTKKPKSAVPGDLPRKIIQEFWAELATSMGKFFRGIIRTYSGLRTKNVWSQKQKKM